MDFTNACMNQGRGCNFTARRTEVGLHEKVCVHRLVPCPDSKFGSGCPRMVEFKNLLDHLIELRRGVNPYFEIKELTLRSGRAGTFSFDSRAEYWTNNSICVRGKIFKYLGSHFILNFNKFEGIHYAWVSVIGGPGITSALLGKKHNFSRFIS